MDKNKILRLAAVIILAWAPTASADEEPWTHFIGSYTCRVENKVDLSLKLKGPRSQVLNDSQEVLEFSIAVPLLKRDQNKCVIDAELFEKAVRNGEGMSIITARGVMESECDDRLELKISKFSPHPSNVGHRIYFTDEFADDLDFQDDGGLNFHGGNLDDILHLAGDWRFTYTERRGGGDLVWFSGRCQPEMKPEKFQ